MKQEKVKVNLQTEHHESDGFSAVEAMIAEYTVLRQEIDVYHGIQEKISAYSLLTLGGLITLVGSQRADAFRYAFLIAPLFFVLYGYLFADKTVRILRIADYLHNGLRPKLCKLVGTCVMQWELYKRQTPIYTVARSIYLDASRWFLFVIPGVLSLLMYFHRQPWQIKNVFEVFMLIIDAAALFLLAMFIYDVNETTGIAVRPQLKLDEIDPLSKELFDSDSC